MRQSLQLGALAAANIGIAFLFQWVVLAQLGPGIETDALFAGMTLPQLVLTVISGSLMHVLVPLLAGSDKDRLRHDAWGFLILVGSLFGVLAIVLYVTVNWWVPLTVPGFSDAAKTMTIELTRIQLIGMVFTGINGVQWATYHARQQFIWAEFTPLFVSAFALGLLIWALPLYGVVAAAWISTLRMAVQSLLLAPGMGKPIWPDLRSSAIREAWQRIKPLLLGAAYYKTDPLIDRFLLSTAGSGNLSLYYLAQQIYGAFSQVLNKAIAAPMVPLLSLLYKSGDRAGFIRLYYKKILQVGLISICGVMVFGLVGQSVINLLIGHSNINADNVKDLWWIMLWLSGIFIGGVAGQICASSFYAFGDTITPTRMSMYTYTVFIPIKVVAFHVWGVTGLACITSAYYAINLTIQIYLLEKIIKDYEFTKISHY